MASVLTIGHSNHTLADFLKLLHRHAVEVVADVRSAPYSRFNPHFNREALRSGLKDAGIGYVYLGSELGGRSDDPAYYQDGRICYERVAETPRFKDGLRRLAKGMAEHRIALMCAEKEPLHCHRTLLVAQALDGEGVDIFTHPCGRGVGEPRCGHGSAALILRSTCSGRLARRFPCHFGKGCDSQADGACGPCAGCVTHGALNPLVPPTAGATMTVLQPACSIQRATN